MTVNRFSEVDLTARKQGTCGCGRNCKRQKRFWQTLNPFNKNADGSVKNARDIHEELRVEADAWRAEPITCAVCEGAQG
jgi:hypothetical protein